MNFGSAPDSEGIWEWYDEDGRIRLVSVYNVGAPLGEVYLRVAWWGGYYNVNEEDGREAEWPNRWGKRVGDIGTVIEKRLYRLPDKTNEN